MMNKAQTAYAAVKINCEWDRSDEAFMKGFYCL